MPSAVVWGAADPIFPLPFAEGLESTLPGHTLTVVEDVGADHVMLGTDHPFELADFTPIETVRGLGLDATSTRAILWDNAAGLLGLPVGAAAD